MDMHMSALAALSLAVALGFPVQAMQQADQARTVPVARPAGETQAGAAEPARDQASGAPDKPAVEPAENVGLARVSPDWPRWLTVTLVDRMRVETNRPPATAGAEYDSYFLNRFRLTAAARISPWVQATVQTQDARVGGYAVSPAPKSMQNTFDLRTAYVEVGRKGARGVSATVGRQELTFADGRLMASPDWGNVSRTYDGVRMTAYVPGFRVDAFAAAPVDVTPDAFSRAKYGERVFGAWSTFKRVKPLTYLDVYELVKHNYTAVGETGSKGDQTISTTGVRLGGPIGKAIAWEADNVVQRGHSANDAISAWATHESVSWTIGGAASRPKVGVEYNFASGDQNAKDGTKQTFDQLYASTHGKWGLADQVGWRNMQHVAAKFELSPTRKLKINTALNKFALATLQDAWYGVSGSKLVTNKTATSKDIGWEPDVFAAYTVTRDLTIGAGLAVLLGGDFVKQSTDVQRIWTPYVMWTYKF
jgi:hypothetical protein